MLLITSKPKHAPSKWGHYRKHRTFFHYVPDTDWKHCHLLHADKRDEVGYYYTIMIRISNAAHLITP